MKRILLTSLILLCVCPVLPAQSYMNEEDSIICEYFNVHRINCHGLKWVNERVVINKGDTTTSYYTYEIKGHYHNPGAQLPYNASSVHYYTGSEIDKDNDSIISGIGDTHAQPIYAHCTFTFHNHALDKVNDEGRTILHVGDPPLFNPYYTFDVWLVEQPLYRFSYNIYKDIRDRQFTSWLINSFVDTTVFTRESVIPLEPIVIDGEERLRYALVDEEGNTVAYEIEGIGFDSRDLGDLLTPFTRKPDPDADYQEYCGLSHVIKDGKIIYKGMRFDPSKVYGIPGDMNGDGEISIDDLALLIDRLLTDMPRYTYTGDFSGDGAVDIADVSSLIDYLLTR